MLRRSAENELREGSDLVFQLTRQTGTSIFRTWSYWLFIGDTATMRVNS
jgi:hypothetical protein